MSTSAWAPTGAPTSSRWALVARGLAAILFGFLVWVWPGLTLLVFTFLFGIFAIAAGLFALLGAVRSAEENRRWWLLAIAGVVSIIIGILAFLWPGHAAIAILYLVGIWAVVTGILEIAAAFRSRQTTTSEWLLILGGVISIIFGIVLMASPGVGLLALLWVVGLWAVVYGVVEIVQAFTGRPSHAQMPPQTGQGTYREPSRGTGMNPPTMPPPPEPPGAMPA